MSVPGGAARRSCTGGAGSWLSPRALPSRRVFPPARDAWCDQSGIRTISAAPGRAGGAPRFEAQAYNKPRPDALSIEFTIIIHDSWQVLKNGFPLLYNLNKVDRRRFDESNP